MKHSGTVILLVALNALALPPLLAQPVIPQSTLPVIGDRFPLVPCETSGVEPGPDGSMVNWDFRELKRDETFSGEAFFDFIPKEEAAEQEEFPDADYASLNFDGSYAFFRIDGGTVYRIGAVKNQGDTLMSVQIAEEPEIDAWFPAGFGDTRQADFGGRNKVRLNDQPFESDYRGDKEHRVDAYGTLRLPNGTYHNVLRLKAVRVQEDLFNGAPINTTTETGWFWYSPDYKFWLLRIMERSDGSKDVFYAAEARTVGVAGQERALHLQAAPLPAADKLLLQLQTDVVGQWQGTIVTLRGELVQTVEPALLQPGLNRRTLDVGDLAPGAYLLRMQIGGEILSRKIIIQ